MRYAVLVCRGIVYSYKTPFTKHCFISSIRSHTKFWLDPIIFYSSGCPKKGESRLPGKKIEIDSLELQLKRRRGEAGKHNLLGEIGGIKCTYHILECFLKTSVVKIPKESCFFWNRITGTDVLASPANITGQEITIFNLSSCLMNTEDQAYELQLGPHMMILYFWMFLNTRLRNPNLADLF